MSSSQPRPPTASPACLSSRPSTKAVPHSSSSPVLLFSKKLSDTVSTQCAPAAWAECLLSSCDRHHQPKLVVFEICFRFLKVQSSPATRLFERRAMKQRARAGHQRVYQAVPVDESCTPQLVVTRSTALEDARRHNPVRASSIDRMFVEQLRSTPPTKGGSFSRTASGFSRVQSSPATKLFERRCHEATNKSATPACLSSHPHRRELFPTARRQPFYCFRRSSPTLLQPRSTECC